MLILYILCWLWGLVVLASFIGWGWVLSRFLFKGQRIEIGLQAGWGLGIFVCFGGILNLLHLVYPFMLLGLIGIGLLCCIIQIAIERNLLRHLLKRFPQIFSNTFILIGILLIVMFAVSKYTYSVYHYQFNRHDDFQGYLVHPLKMLQIHCIGEDPFNTRQLVTSLGGTSFLQTLVVCVFPLNFITCIDQGVGLLMALLLIAFWPKAGYTVPGRIALMLLYLAIPITTYIANVTGFVLTIAMFLCLFGTCERYLLRSRHFIGSSIVIALMASAICTLKSTCIVPAVLFIGTAYILRYACLRTVGQTAGAIRECIATCVLTGLMLLPWMILMYRSGGTPLYPILGEGYYASGYTDFNLHANGKSWDLLLFFKECLFVFSNIYFVSFCLLFAYFFNNIRKYLSDYPVLLSFGLSVFLGILAIWYGASGYGVVRYSFPFICAAVFILLIEIIGRECLHSSLSMTMGSRIVLIVIGIAIGDSIGYIPTFIFGLNDRIQNIVNNQRLDTDDDRNCLVCLQESVPPGASVLARLEKPFLLDFRRNPVYVVDLPGETSPPPGLPYDQGPEVLADYLILHSICYVAYDYESKANYSDKLLEQRLRPNTHKWVSFQAERIRDFHENLGLLMKTRNLVYNDGERCVINLSERRL